MTDAERSPDFIEALARGLQVIRVFDEGNPVLTLTEVATASGLARPTARRILITLMDLGYVRSNNGTFFLTPRVLELGMSYISSAKVFTLLRTHLQALSRATNESCSIAQLDGSDALYVSRVAVPKLVSLRVSIGTRFPANATSLGKVLLAGLDEEGLERALSTPSRSGTRAAANPSHAELVAELRQVRAQGWAMSDGGVAPAIRSIAAPIRDGRGNVVAAVNVSAHAMETPREMLLDVILPQLLDAASEMSTAWELLESLPIRPAPTDRRR